MNQTNVGSNIDIVFMSAGKEERGFEVEAAGEKDNIFENNMEIVVEDAELTEKDTIKTNGGIILQFPKGSYTQVFSSRKARMKMANDSKKVHKTAKRNSGIEK